MGEDAGEDVSGTAAWLAGTVGRGAPSRGCGTRAKDFRVKGIRTREGAAAEEAAASFFVSRGFYRAAAGGASQTETTLPGKIERGAEIFRATC